MEQKTIVDEESTSDPLQERLIPYLAELKELKDKELTKSFEVILSILLSISLASFLIIIVERISSIRAFLFDITSISLLYIIVIYSFTFFKLKKIYFLIPRTIIVLLLSILPYVILRIFIEAPVTKLGNFGFSVYLIILLVSGIIWGLWEGSYIDNNFKIKNGCKDIRFIVALVLFIVYIIVLMNGGNII